MKIILQVVQSIIIFCKLALTRNLHVKKNHLGESYKISDRKIYTVFRETTSDKDYEEKECTVVIGFRLKFINNNRLFHILFQKLSLLDTPVWVGFLGFKKKYWMIEKSTNDYLGLYEYQGRKNAEAYVEYIISILKPFSINNSIWYEIIDVDFDTYQKNTFYPHAVFPL